MRVLLLWKPYGVVSQFRTHPTRPTLAALGLPGGVYPAGRLDHDSEGLLVLTGDGALQHRLTDPERGHPRTYWVQVEREPMPADLSRLSRGIGLKDGPTRPCTAKLIAAPALPPRKPPVRRRKTVPTAWLELTLTEGRNRQVRRMTAAVGHPTLRLVRCRIGRLTLEGLEPGRWRELASKDLSDLLAKR